MTTQEALALFNRKNQELHALGHATGVLFYDAETVAPRQSAEGRGKTIEYLSGKSYEIETSEELKEAVQQLVADKASLSFRDRRQVEVFVRSNEYVASIPQDEYVAYSSLINEASAVWRDAKINNDFAAFAPYLQRIFDTNRRFAGYYRPDKEPYDVQLDQFEQGLTMEKADAFFTALKERIVPLLKKVQQKPQIDDDFLRRSAYSVAQQRELSKYLMGVLTIDPDCCVIGEVEHPFTTGFNKKDVRITTHYYPDAAISSMYSVIHEGGHALYELHSGDELEDTVLSGGVSMGVHESQSRFFENLIGRSRAFLALVLPKLQELFPEQLGSVTAEELYRAVNKAQPSLIRTEADELTYALHILVRYELEKAIFKGEAKVEDLPRLWNEKYREYLGVEVPDDRSGVLQDTHWSNGLVGYFPSYALGSAYGAQLLAKMKQTVDVDAAIASGDLHPITAWLEERIWKHGGLYTPNELLERAMEAPFDPKYYTDYLEKKFSEIYGL